MAYGLRGKIRDLQNKLAAENAFIDFAIQFVAVRRDEHGKIVRTDEKSPVFGGRLMKWSYDYNKSVAVEPKMIEVTPAQLEYIMSSKNIITAKGGRGSGKTKALCFRLLKLLVENPGWDFLAVSPDYKHTKIIWDRMIPLISPLLLPKPKGVSKSERILRTWTNSTVQFLSARDPDNLRGWDVNAACVDEEKDISDESIDILMLCLRRGKPILFGAGTPEIGEYQARYERYSEDTANSEVFSMPSTDNIFVPHDVFELAKKHMDPRRYQQEVLAEFVEVENQFHICRAYFDPAVHGVNMPILGVDNTRQYVERKTGHSKRYIAGIDYNFRSPNYAAIYRIFDDDKWILIDVIAADGIASDLAEAMIKNGYSPDRTLCVDDASGEYKKANAKGEIASTRIMRGYGFECCHHRKNPNIRERVNAFMVKLKPFKGKILWYYDRGKVSEYAENVLQNVKWFGDKIDKSEGYDHIFDAMTYPIHYFSPAEKWQLPKIYGYSRR